MNSESRLAQLEIENAHFRREFVKIREFMHQFNSRLADLGTKLREFSTFMRGMDAIFGDAGDNK